jgi:DNA-directed RNA polymerase omega subunit
MPTAHKDPDEGIEQSSSQEIDSKYRLIILAAKRSKQLQRGARPRIDIDTSKHKPTRIALEEVIRGKVRFYRITPGEAAAPVAPVGAPLPRLRPGISLTAPNDAPRADIHELTGFAQAGGLEGDDDERIPRRPPVRAEE